MGNYTLAAASRSHELLIHALRYNSAREALSRGTVRMNSMRAAVVRGHGGTDKIELAQVPVPVVRPGSVLVAVHAASLNRLDLWVLNGLPGLTLQFPHIGGSEVAGTITEIGPDVEGYSVGDRVVVNPALFDAECEWCRAGEESLCVNFGVLGEHTHGGFAEFVAVPSRNLLRLPDDIAFTDAAATPLVYQTAWRGLIGRAGLRSGASVLITGASGGVSTAAIQIAKRAEATVYAVTSGPEKVEEVHRLGADVVIDRNEASFSEQVWKLTRKRGVDVVFDSVGEAVWEGAVRSLARDGTLVTYGATTGLSGKLDIRRVFWKQLKVVGSTMASKAEFETVMALVFAGELAPVIDSILPLERAREAYERLAAGDQFGKIVLTVP